MESAPPIPQNCPTWGKHASMSIRIRLSLALTAVGAVLFGGYGLWSYLIEREELYGAATAELRVLGRSLGTSLGNAIRDRQASDIEETLAAVEALAPRVDIHVEGIGHLPLARSTGARLDDQISRSLGEGREVIMLDPADAPTRLIYATPLLDERNVGVGAIAISRPLDDLRADLDRTRDRLILVVVTFLAATMISGVVLGTIHVTRPITRLLAGMRQVRGGDFRSQVTSARDDELGELVVEFNAMLAALDAAEQSRAQLEHGLQRVDKLVTIGQLSAGLAHEIGSPLQVLAGRASVLRNHPEEEVRRQAELISSQCDRITGVIEQLLSVGRRKPVALGDCDLVKPVRDVIDLLVIEARGKGIALTLELEGRSHQIRGRADQLQQVALNLVRNALAATPEGGRVVVRVERAGDVVRLVVRDTGCGIPPEVQARMFEPFFTTRGSEGGTGLGLAVVRSIVSEHGGTIEVASNGERGAELVVTLPAILEARDA